MLTFCILVISPLDREWVLSGAVSLAFSMVPGLEQAGSQRLRNKYMNKQARKPVRTHSVLH